MRELVLATIADQPDINVVGVVDDQSSILDIVDQARPDVVIVTLDKTEARPEICDLLLGRFPTVRVLALASERNTSILYSASHDILASRIETSEEGVLNALRGRVIRAQAPHAANGSKAN
jgi:DNA-binding NarL/FixJ family response regulator